MAAVTDLDLFERIRAGDALALKALYTRHRVAIYRFALRLTRSETSAEDVVSEVFVDVWRNSAAFEGWSQPRTFLLGVARNKAYSLLRRRRDEELDEEKAAEIEDEADTPEVALQKRAKSDILRACLDRLSAAHREVIDLVYYHDKSIDEVAEIVGAPVGTVKTRMYHARKRLAEFIADAGEDRGWP
jgi:RNA polymerase sigma-70 factor (ECF subfamily)